MWTITIPLVVAATISIANGVALYRVGAQVVRLVPVEADDTQIKDASGQYAVDLSRPKVASSYVRFRLGNGDTRPDTDPKNNDVADEPMDRSQMPNPKADDDNEMKENKEEAISTTESPPESTDLPVQGDDEEKAPTPKPMGGKDLPKVDMKTNGKEKKPSQNNSNGDGSDKRYILVPVDSLVFSNN